MESRRCFGSAGEGLTALYGWKDLCIYWPPLYCLATGDSKFERRKKSTSATHLVRKQIKAEPMKSFVTLLQFTVGCVSRLLHLKRSEQTSDVLELIGIFLSMPVEYLTFFEVSFVYYFEGCPSGWHPSNRVVALNCYYGVEHRRPSEIQPVSLSKQKWWMKWGITVLLPIVQFYHMIQTQTLWVENMK